MSIPRIEPYELPSRSELPKNRLRSNIDSNGVALLIHDAQQYFLDFFGEHNVTMDAVLDNMCALRAVCRERDIPVVYTAQPSTQTPRDRGLLQDMWGSGITAFPSRASITPTLSPSADDLVLTKWRYSAFVRSELLTWMRQHRRTQLIICGVYAHIGCQCTAADAFMSDITPIVVSDAVADFSRVKHLGALEYVAGCCGLVFDTQHVLAALREQTRTTSQADHPTPHFRDALRADVATLLGVEASSVQPDFSLFELGMDSVRLMTLVERWRGRGYSADLMALAETPTLSAWAEKFKPVSPDVASR